MERQRGQQGLPCPGRGGGRREVEGTHLGQQILGCPSKGWGPLALSLSLRLYPSTWGPTALVSLPLPVPMQRLPHRKQLSGQNQRDSATLQSLNKYKDTNHPQAGPWLRPAPACDCGVSHHWENPRCYPLLQGLWIGTAPGKHWLLFPEDLAQVYSDARSGSSWGRGWP